MRKDLHFFTNESPITNKFSWVMGTRYKYISAIFHCSLGSDRNLCSPNDLYKAQMSTVVDGKCIESHSLNLPTYIYVYIPIYGEV